MNNKVIYALGVGASTPVFCEIATACGFYVAGLYHYNETRTGERVFGMEIKGSFEDLFKHNLEGMNFLLTMGDMDLRNEITEKIQKAGGKTPTLIHPMTCVSPNSTISDDGVVIGPMVVVQAGTVISKGCVLRDMALVCHNAQIDPFAFVGPKALVGAFVHVNEFAFIGQASTLVSHKASSIGRHSLIGAGSVVTKNVGDNVVAVGVPARDIKNKL